MNVQPVRCRRVVEHRNPFPAGGCLALGATDLDEPDSMSPQLGKNERLDVAQGLFKLVASVCRDDDEVPEIEIPTAGLSEPAQEDRGGYVNSQAVAEGTVSQGGGASVEPTSGFSKGGPGVNGDFPAGPW